MEMSAMSRGQPRTCASTEGVKEQRLDRETTKAGSDTGVDLGRRRANFMR